MPKLIIDPHFKNAINDAYLLAIKEIKCPKDEIEFAKRAKRGDIHAKDMLFNKFLPLILKMAMRDKFSTFNGDIGELIDSAAIGYDNALAQFDTELGNGFGVFFMHHAFNAMQKEYFNDTLLHVPENHFKKLDETAPKGKTLATTISADVPIDGENSSRMQTLMDTFKSKHDGDEMFNNAFAQEQRDICDSLLSHLEERERNILNDLYLADTAETVRSLGKKYNVSHERIRQISAKALKKLRGITDDLEIELNDVVAS